jgi:GNAT superfamily N-acetyltransferase
MSIEMLSNAQSKEAIALILPIQREEFGVPITVQDQPDLLDIDGYYIRPGGGFWGAFADRELIGTIALINAGHGIGVIRKMFVKKEYRGKEPKAAQLLIDTLITHSRAKGLTHLYLGSVDQMKAAHRFYERNGFKRIEPRDLPKNFPRMALDTIFYHLSLTQ